MWQNPAPVLITSSWAAQAVWVVLEEMGGPPKRRRKIIVEMARRGGTAEHQDRGDQLQKKNSNRLSTKEQSSVK